MNITTVNFAEKNYVKEVTKKTQIVIHHTVSGEGVEGDISWWNKLTEKIATHFIIDRLGVVYQLFDEKYWAYHLGTTSEHFKKFSLQYQNLNKSTISIELDVWGPVLPFEGKFYPVKFNPDTKKYVPNTAAKPINDNPEEYCTGYRGHRYYEMYTTKQLLALQQLLQQLTQRHNIPTVYAGDNFWVANNLALSGQSGIWGHCSFRTDKSDPHPQQQLVNILKSI